MAANQLPPELLSLIFNHVTTPSLVSSFDPAKADPSIFSCLQCCKKWHEVALQVLYRDVVLQNRNFVSSTQCVFHPDALRWVRSLTILLNSCALVATPRGLSIMKTEEEAFAITPLTSLLPYWPKWQAWFFLTIYYPIWGLQAPQRYTRLDLIRPTWILCGLSTGSR